MFPNNSGADEQLTNPLGFNEVNKHAQLRRGAVGGILVANRKNNDSKLCSVKSHYGIPASISNFCRGSSFLQRAQGGVLLLFNHNNYKRTALLACNSQGSQEAHAFLCSGLVSGLPAR